MGSDVGLEEALAISRALCVNTFVHEAMLPELLNSKNNEIKTFSSEKRNSSKNHKNR